MPLFIDRLPFHQWTDATRVQPITHYTVVLPVILAEPMLPAPPLTGAMEWALDTGNRGEAFAFRHHLLQAGLDPTQRRFPQTITIQTVSSRLVVPLRDADLWLVSNIPALQATPYRLVLHRGLAFHDTPSVPDPEYNRPLIGIRVMRSAGLRVEIDFAADTISVWTP